MDEFNEFKSTGHPTKLTSVYIHQIKPLKIRLISGVFRFRTIFRLRSRWAYFFKFFRKRSHNHVSVDSENSYEQYLGPNLLKIARVSRADHSHVVFGPWTGELGMEILYWAPWVFDNSESCDMAISRGGTKFLYPSVSDYSEVFDYFDPESWISYQTSQIKTYGGQKQRIWLNSEFGLLKKILQNQSPKKNFTVIHPKDFFKFAYPNIYDDIRLLTNYVNAMRLFLPDFMVEMSKQGSLDKTFAPESLEQRVAYGVYTREGVSNVEISSFMKHPLVVEAMKDKNIYSLQSVFRDVHHMLKHDLVGMNFPLRDSSLAKNLTSQAALIFNCGKLITTHGG